MQISTYRAIRDFHLRMLLSYRKKLRMEDDESNPIVARHRETNKVEFQRHRERIAEIRAAYRSSDVTIPLWMHERWALDDASGHGFGSGFRVVPDKRTPLEFGELRREEINGRVYEYEIHRNAFKYYYDPADHTKNCGWISWMAVFDLIKAAGRRAKDWNTRYDNPEKSMSVGELKKKLRSKKEDFFDYGEIAVRVGDKLYRVKDVVHGDHGAEIIIREEEYQHVKPSKLD